MSSVQPGQVAAGTFAAKPGRTPLAFPGRVTIMLERAPQVGRRGTSATADSHTAPEVKNGWRTRTRRRWHLHFTPDLQLMAPDRALVQGTERQRLRRGVFTSVADLTAAITEWAEHWNTDLKPFVWKATAEQIITKVRRGRQSPTRT